MLLQTSHTCRMARQTAPLRTPPHPALDKLPELAPSVPGWRPTSPAVRATVRRRAQRDIHDSGRDVARICSSRWWWSTLSRPIVSENSWLHCYSRDRNLSVRVRSAPASSDGLQLDGQVDERFRHLAAATRCDTMWYTTAMCGRRPCAHWGAAASTRSLALVHRCASKRIPAHPKCARAHPAWLGARRSCQEFLRQRE